MPPATHLHGVCATDVPPVLSLSPAPRRIFDSPAIAPSLWTIPPESAAIRLASPPIPPRFADFPWPLRKVRYFDADTRRDLVFLTNHLDIPAITVAGLYRSRWQVELFFRWIKSHMGIKHFLGTSPNAVKTQIWIAVSVYLIVAILHKQLNLPGHLHRTLQLLSVHPFEKMPLHELLAKVEFNILPTQNNNQLLLFQL